MKQTPIIFCTEMIREYRASGKTQTRRVVKLTPKLRRMHGNLSEAWIDSKGSTEEYLCVPCTHNNAGCTVSFHGIQRLHNPYGEPGKTKLWIREAWYDIGQWRSGDSHHEKYWSGMFEGTSLKPLYVADDPQMFCDAAGLKWDIEENGRRKDWGSMHWRKKPSIYLPRWACRMTMPLTRVRVERLQDITAEDILDEGFESPDSVMFPKTSTRDSLHEIFKKGWNKINGARAGCRWEDNPWVFVLEFPPYKKETS